MPDLLRELAQLIISGLSVGSLYALVALGFVLLFKASGVLNFAHGDMMMISAYFGMTLIAQLKLPWPLALLLTFLAAAALGAAIQVTMLRPMVGKPLFSVVMVTIGVSILLQIAVGAIWGYTEQVFPSPFSSAPIALPFDLFVSEVDLWVIGIAVLCIGIFAVFFNYSRLGLHMRATAENHEAALMMGVDVGMVFIAAWAIANLIAGVAGVFLASLQILSTQLGVIGLRAFPAAILGGMESAPGAIVGGLVIGIIETIAARYLGAEMRDIAAMGLLLIVLMVRPYGLFGKREIQRV